MPQQLGAEGNRAELHVAGQAPRSARGRVACASGREPAAPGFDSWFYRHGYQGLYGPPYNEKGRGCPALHVHCCSNIVFQRPPISFHVTILTTRMSLACRHLLKVVICSPPTARLHNFNFGLMKADKGPFSSGEMIYGKNLLTAPGQK